jgi:MFS family permease
MTRRQVMQQVLAEALFTGGLGTLMGLALGPLLGYLVLAAMQWFGLQTGRGSVASGSMGLAIGMGMSISLLSALVPARRAARVAPLAALRESEAIAPDEIIFHRKDAKNFNVRLGGPLPGAKRAGQVGVLVHIRAFVGFVLLAVLWVYLLIAPPGEWSGSHPPWDWGMLLILWGVWLIGLALAIPALVGGLVSGLGLLLRGRGAVGRLIGDNLARAPGRVTLTALTFAVGLMVMVATAGLVSFGNDVLVARLSENMMRSGGWVIYPFNRVEGLAQLSAFDVNAPGFDKEIVDEVRRLAQGRASVGKFYTVVAPEISSPMPGFPSMLVMDIEHLAQPNQYNLIEGDWSTALSILKGQCGVLTTPAVAARHKVKIGDAFTVSGREGPITCVVAGLGSGGVAPLSIIGPGAKDAFVPADNLPDGLNVRPLPGTDVAALEADLDALHARYGDKAFISRPQDELAAIINTSDQLMQIFNGLVLLAVVAAALGTINTTLMSVAERQRELGLLRAVGATRRQITLAVMGEAALTGLIGALLGTLAGVGLGAIFALAYGGITFGLMHLPLWEAVGVIAPRAVFNGLAGALAAPLLAALAAYPAVRTVTCGSAIETMSAARSTYTSRITHHAARTTQRAARTPGAQYAVGALQKRFALGTAILMLIVLAGLIAIVVEHTRSHFMQLTLDKTRQLVTVNAGMIELSLPKRARQLDWNTLRASGMFGSDQSLSQFKSLKEDMQKNGVLDLTIADSDNIILVNMEIRKIGQLAPRLQSPDQASAFLEDKAGRTVIQAIAPIRNQDGQILGSARATVDAHHLTDLQAQLWSALGGAGLVMVIVGVLLSIALSAPLARAAQQLAEHAAQVRRGQYTLFAGLPGRGLVDRIKSIFSVQTRLTIVLVVLMMVMVGVLEFVAIPIERYYIEDMLTNNLTVWMEWMAHAASNSDVNLAALMRGRTPEPFEMVQMLQSLDLERLQQVSADAFGQDVAYVALVNTRGKIVFSDQLALIDELAPAPAETAIESATWHGESVWIVSTPLRQSEGGKQLGVLRVAVRREQVDDFLDESRNLFVLCGLVAILAGVLAAQAIGGVVAAPISPMAAGQRAA